MGVLLVCAALVAAVVLLVTRRKARPWLKTATIALALVILLPVTLVVGYPAAAWGVNVVRCGRRPAIASRFAAAYSYSLPGDDDYFPSILNNTYFCTAREAEKGGFNRTVLRRTAP
ncbi:MAG: hypothetical protein ACYDGR_05450 [Candidatus Dormibacteria bacterium]